PSRVLPHPGPGTAVQKLYPGNRLKGRPDLRLTIVVGSDHPDLHPPPIHLEWLQAVVDGGATRILPDFEPEGDPIASGSIVERHLCFRTDEEERPITGMQLLRQGEELRLPSPQPHPAISRLHPGEAVYHTGPLRPRHNRIHRQPQHLVVELESVAP